MHVVHAHKRSGGYCVRVELFVMFKVHSVNNQLSQKVRTLHYFLGIQPTPYRNMGNLIFPQRTTTTRHQLAPNSGCSLNLPLLPLAKI